MTIQTKVIEQYFPVVLFVMLYEVVLNFESVGTMLCHGDFLYLPRKRTNIYELQSFSLSVFPFAHACA